MADLYSSSRMLPLLCVMMMLGMLAHQQGADALYYPADKIVGYGNTWRGLSAPMLQAEWYKRYFSGSNPSKPSKNDCHSGSQQNVKHVFFLDGDSVSGTLTKQVTVKANRAIFFPLLTQGWISNDLTPDIEAYPGVVNRFLSANNLTSLSAWVDNQIVRNPVQYMGGSSTFAYTFTVPNILNITTFYDTRTEKFGLTSYPTFDYGVYLFLKPLPKGKHIIKSKGQNNDLSLVYETTYVITVV